MQLGAYLKKHGVVDGLQSVLLAIAGVLPQIAEVLKTAQEGYAGHENVFGEKQLKLDVYCNKVFVEALRKNPNISALASEELKTELKGIAGDNGYAAAFDPLDGSSLVDVNLAVGSIFGFYRGIKFIGQKGRNQVAALIVIYGPRLTIMISIGCGVAEFVYHPDKKSFLLNKENLCLAETKKMFAPGNLRACSSEKWYVDLLEYWVKNNYTLRYSGGMSPDVNQILKKGGGIFSYPGYKEMPDGKLRLLYECAPVAYLVSQAGGAASSGMGDILDITVERLEQRTPIFLGSKGEVEVALGYLKTFSRKGF